MIFSAVIDHLREIGSMVRKTHDNLVHKRNDISITNWTNSLLFVSPYLGTNLSSKYKSHQSGYCNFGKW